METAEQSAQQFEQQAYIPPVQEETLLSWDAAERPFKKRDREYYTTIAIIVALLCVILFFAGQFLPIAVVISFAFVSYALASVPPSSTTNHITTFGIRAGGKLYQWKDLGRFWFTTKLGQEVLNVEHHHTVLTKIMVLLGNMKKESIGEVLSQYLPQEVPPPTWLDKASSWLQEKFPLEKTG